MAWERTPSGEGYCAIVTHGGRDPASVLTCFDQLGAVVIGLNPDLRPPSGVKFCSTIPEGMISVVIGGNGWAGGDNSEAFSLTVCLPGSSLRVDGRPVVQDGVLTPTAPLPAEEEGTPAEPAARK